MKDRADVVVVGGGGSGLAAALSAAQCGASVIVCEKNPQLGGTTGIAVGSFTAAGTSLQQRQGIQDSSEHHHEDMGLFAGPREMLNNDALRRCFAAHAAETFEWLVSLGVEFHGPSPEPPNRVPRMHNVIPNAKAYIATLQRRAQRNGVRFKTGCTVKGLVRSSSGRIQGVTVEASDSRFDVQASRGVILAAGDYSNGQSLKQEYLGGDAARVEGINPTATGDGHVMGREVGAELVNMDVVYGPEIRFVPPPKKPFTQLLPAGPVASRVFGFVADRLPKTLIRRLTRRLLVTWQHPEPTLFEVGGLLINREGRRFCNEMDHPERQIPLQPGNEAFIVFDSAIGQRLEEWPNFISTAPDIAYAYLRHYKSGRPDVYHEAGSVSELADLIGVDVGNMKITIDGYNHLAGGEATESLGVAPPIGPPLTKPPYIALGPARSYIVTTEGGLRIDHQMRALDKQGMVIEGLYAVGCNGMGGQILWGHGLHIAWALTSGRLAGRHAAT